MTKKRLKWQNLLPNLKKFADIFNNELNLTSLKSLETLQPRLINGLVQFCHIRSTTPLMLIMAPEENEYFQLITNEIKQILPNYPKLIGSKYIITDTNISEQPASKKEDNFAASDTCIWQSWVELEQLFGTLHYIYPDKINLQPGLVHKVNGGILIIGVKSLIMQPLLWIRLKQMILQNRFDWLSLNKNQVLPLPIPSMPLNLKLIIIGNREKLAELNKLDPYIARLSIYGEYESEFSIIKKENMMQWCYWVNTLVYRQKLPILQSDAWPELIKQSIRYIGDQKKITLCPQWISRKIKEASLYINYNQKTLTASNFIKSENDNIWRENYLEKTMQNDIIDNQVLVETKGQVIGQINALSVMDFLGHPSTFGIPTRISCVVHLGDGEINNIEQKSELGGNIHAKGMMIMQAFLMSALKLEQHLPFSASLVFEQSYDKIDGDSASLAEGIALISALANKPINQQIAITGSVDQFGRVQPIGGLNEKIECFFDLCKTRKLTKTQGVIIPNSNTYQLCLHRSIIKAVKEKKFSIWTIDTIDEALEILTGFPFYHNKSPNLLAFIRQRISNINNLKEKKHHLPWIFRWISLFIKNNK